jgi:DNA-binding XRE family transcriptional regulator
MTPTTIRAARESLSLTQTQAAELIGVTRVTWTRWELGTTPMPESQWLMFRHRAGIEQIPFKRI